MLNMPTFKITDQDGRTRRAEGPTRDAVIAEANRQRILVASCIEVPNAPTPAVGPQTADPNSSEVHAGSPQSRESIRTDVRDGVMDAINTLLVTWVVAPGLAVLAVAALGAAVSDFEGSRDQRRFAMIAGAVFSILPAWLICHIHKIRRWSLRIVAWSAMVIIPGAMVSYGVALLLGMKIVL